MSSPLLDWPRPRFAQGGGTPFLFYVVFGHFEKLPPLSADNYRSAGVPPGLSLSSYRADQNPDVFIRFQEGYLWNEFCARNTKLATQVAATRECMILKGEIEDSETLNYLRDSVGLLAFLLDHGGITIYDPFMFQWWEPVEWRKLIFEPAEPVPSHHVVILKSDEPTPKLTWLHTRGMRKFGRPDLSIHDVPARYCDATVELIDRFIEFQALGGIVDEGQRIKMKSLPQGMSCHHQGDVEDPDFNNVHVEITWRRIRRLTESFP